MSTQTYLINDPAKLINLPTYSWVPADALTTFTYIKTFGPSFVTLVGSPAQINVYTINTANAGTYTVTIRVTETASGLTNDQTFSIQVRCATSLDPSATITTKTYYIADVALTFSTSYVVTPSTCPKSITYVATLANGDPLPAVISLTGQSFTIYSTNYSTVVGTYSVRITATDSVNSLVNSNQTFNVNILCVKVGGISVASNPIPLTVNYQIQSTLQKTLLTMPTYTLTNPSCAPHIYYTIVKSSD